MFKLLRYFSIASLFAFIIVIVILSLFYRQTAIDDLIKIEEEKNIALTQVFANSLWPRFAPYVTLTDQLGQNELQNRPEIAELHGAVLTQMNGLSVIKVKVYNLEGTTIFSTEASQIGEDKSQNEGYRLARTGAVASELTHRDTFSAFEGIIEDRDVFSSYIPIRSNGLESPIEGVFELYSDVTPLLQQIEDTQRHVVIGVTLILTVLYICLYLIVKHADGIIQRQYCERNDAQQALMKSEEALRQIYQITSMPTDDFERKVEKLLVLGCELFGLPIGILAHVAGDRYEVLIAQSPVPHIASGNVYKLADTYCSETLKSKEPIGFEHAVESEWKMHPCYEQTRLEAYFGIRIHVEQEIYGTLNFSSLHPRQDLFTVTEQEILKLMVQWIGGEIARQKTTETLHRAQKMESLGILAGGVAHDFNNMLVAMLGQASLAQAKLSQEHCAFPHIGKVVRAAERAADLTRQMLAYSGRGHFKVEAIDLNSMIKENLHLFEATIPKHIRFHTDLNEPLPLVEADVGQIQQVIMNLLINATEAFDQQTGIITIRTHSRHVEQSSHMISQRQYSDGPLLPGQYVTLEVADEGAGMNAETLSKIFDPFFSTKESGRGLGLAVAIGIVRGHRGTLRVQSEVEKGSIFELFLPASKRILAAPVALKMDTTAKEDLGLVLVIDDEESVREVVADILEQEGIATLSADSGAAGLSLYKEREGEIDLVLLDLSMPGMGGEEVFLELCKIHPGVKVVLSSGYNEVEVTKRFVGKGLAGFLQKPYNAESLVQSLKQY